MAESALSVDYQRLVRELARQAGLGDAYSTGTVTVASGVVTLASGTFPSWAATAAVNIAGSWYNVSTWDSDTQITLVDTSLTVGSASNYVLLQCNSSDTEAVGLDIDDSIDSGLRRFYYPMRLPNEKGTHQWTFLRPVATLSLSVAGGYDYDLPDDCGQDAESFTFSAGDSQRAIAKVAEEIIRRKRAEEGAGSGPPEYVAVRPKSGFDASSSGSRFEAVFHPAPDGNYTIEYHHNVIPGDLDPTNRYPQGGAIHAETVIAACMAAYEEKIDGAPGPHAEKFSECLSASVNLDRQIREQNSDSFPTTAATPGTVDWLWQEVGSVMGVGSNPATWDTTTFNRVNQWVQRGIRQFYMPGMTGVREHRAHRWSFLRPITSLSLNGAYSTGTVEISSGVVTLTSGTFPSWAASGEVVISGDAYTVSTRDSDTQVTLDDTSVDEDAGTEYSLQQLKYDLPSDYAGLEGPMTYPRGSNYFYPPITIVSELNIRGRLQNWETADRPRMAGIRPKTPDATTGTRWEIEFWPPPDADYTLWYRYKSSQSELTTGQFPLGGQDHYETILKSCLAVADPKRMPEYLQSLAASIEIDQAEMTPESLGFNLDGPGSTWDDYANYRDGEAITYDNSTPSP